MRFLQGLLLCGSLVFAAKQVYIPTFITNTGMDLNNAASQWSYSRSMETDNWIIFWEAGFGSDPSKATGDYHVDMETLKAVAENSFAMYTDSLKMVIKGSSLTDKYKQMIFLLHSTEWAAYGSGQDDKVGTLHVNPAAANIGSVLAHEIGHCFEYMTGADVSGGGYRYGFGVNGAGGNGFWEQVAQWESFQVFPQEQFQTYDFNEYVGSNHLHILHETPRYANYFLPDFWTFKQGRDFMGKLWHGARFPEDPVETYQRLTGISQETFNDEMFEHAARLTTWDIPRIRSYGANYLTRRAQVKMKDAGDDFWLVDSAVTPENYGYNSIQLNAPAGATTVSVDFQGRAGAAGFRSLNRDKGGWRFGFVALSKDGTRVYSAMGKANSGADSAAALEFAVPAQCARLWLVVVGAPREHWHHAWDDDNSNDEQWPYQVRFGNTNLLGEPNRAVVPIATPQLSPQFAGVAFWRISDAKGAVVANLAVAPADADAVLARFAADRSGVFHAVLVQNGRFLAVRSLVRP